MLRAAPKNFFGLCNDAGSIPPDNVLPDAGTTRLYALASLVILSKRITTSLPCSTTLLLFLLPFLQLLHGVPVIHQM